MSSSKGRFEELNNEVTEDFLEVDKPIPGQNFVCLSFVSPDKLLARKEDYYFHEYNKKRFQNLQKEMNSKLEELVNSAVDGKVDLSKLTEFQTDFVKATDLQVKQSFNGFTEDYKDFRYANEETVEEKFHEDNNFQTTVRGIKVRGVYNTVKEAQIRAKVLQRLDPSFHIFVGQVGYWLPWDPNADKIENQEYQNNQLNDIVKKYKTNELKRDEFYEQQKQERKKEAIKKNLELSDSGTKLAVGSAKDAEVSLEETNNNLNSVDPWMQRKMNPLTEETTATSAPTETDYHEEVEEM
jgi:hypothetical protein